MRAQALRLLDLLWPTRPGTWSDAVARVRPVLANMLRLTLASVIAYLLTRWAISGPLDLTSALTALLVMQASAANSFKQGMLKVVGVFTGVGLALAASSLVGMSWWSLGTLIFSALVVARLLRLGDAALELPISAMLILGSVGRPDVAAETRAIGTLIGTGVGIVLPLVLPPALPYRSAVAAVRRVATQQAELLRSASATMADSRLTRPMVSGWIARARPISDQVSRAHRQVEGLNEVRKFNSRALGTADIAPVLVSALDSLEACLLSLRSMFATMQRRVPVADHPSISHGGGGAGVFTAHAQQAIASVLDDLANCIDAFGEMVEAEGLGNEQRAEQTFVENYRALRRARTELAEVMTSQVEPGDQWLVQAGILGQLDHVLQQLDIDARSRMRERWKASQLGRRLPESTIGPRTTTIDRFRHARMRARQRHAPSWTETEADFLGDDEPTQRIARVERDVLDDGLAAAPQPADDVRPPAKRRRPRRP